METGDTIFPNLGEIFDKHVFFYEAFLKSRDILGIHNPMYLDLLPKLNINWPDILPPDSSISQYAFLNVTFVLLSRTHIDQCGNIGRLRKDIPIANSPENMVIMELLQNGASRYLEEETTWVTPLQPANILRN